MPSLNAISEWQSLKDMLVSPGQLGGRVMSEFQPFVMERMMSLFEQEGEFNLSESGVHPMLLSELLA